MAQDLLAAADHSAHPLEYTPTHKIKKFESKKEGFNPVEIDDPLYVLLPGESEYQLLTGEIYTGIMENKYKF